MIYFLVQEYSGKKAFEYYNKISYHDRRDGPSIIDSYKKRIPQNYMYILDSEILSKKEIQLLNKNVIILKDII